MFPLSHLAMSRTNISLRANPLNNPRRNQPSSPRPSRPKSRRRSRRSRYNMWIHVSLFCFFSLSHLAMRPTILADERTHETTFEGTDQAADGGTDEAGTFSFQLIDLSAPHGQNTLIILSSRYQPTHNPTGSPTKQVRLSLVWLMWLYL